MTQTIMVLAVDIETNGYSYLRNGIKAIGYCLGDLTGKTIEKGKYCLKLEEKNKEFDVKCRKFWDDHKDILKILDDEAEKELGNAKESIKTQITKFADKLDSFDLKYDLRIVSGNPVFDIGFINYYFDKYLGRRPICFKFGEEFRPTFSTDCYSRGVLNMGYKSMWTDDKYIIKKFSLDVTVNPTHLPDDDAEYIYSIHVKLINKMKDLGRIRREKFTKLIT
jgi:hypothetical protein